MTVKIDMVEGALLAANATTDMIITDFGAVKGAIIIAMVAPTGEDNVVGNNAQYSIGFYEPVGSPPFGAVLGQVACGNSNENGVGTTNEKRNSKIGVGVLIPRPSGGVRAEYSVSPTTNGLRFTRVSASNDCWVRCIFFGGTGLEVAPLFGIDLDSVASPQTVSGYTFTPHLMFALTAGMTNVAADTPDSVYSFGVAGLHQGATLRQYSNNMSTKNGEAYNSQDHRATLKSGNVLAPIDINAVTPFLTMQIDSFNADGFTYSWQEVTQSVMAYGLVIGLKDPTKLRLSDSTLTNSATSWASESMESPPVFGLLSMIDGVTGLGTGYTSVGAINLTALTPSKQFCTSFLSDPVGFSSQTVAHRLRTTYPTAWRSLLKAISGVYQTMTGTLAINGSNQIALSSMTGVPARDTVLWYLAILEHAENVYKGPDELFAVFNGDDHVSAVYQGPNQIY